MLIGTSCFDTKILCFGLGLMIIQYGEQRFGVKRKETFEELKTEVDVLTLTATPIPRTHSS